MRVDRDLPKAQISEQFSVHPVVALTGPRQCGKTTLARQIADKEPETTYFDLESAVDRRKLETPELTLGRLAGLVVIDEVQLAPNLLETIRVLVDREDNTTRFLLLGSASPTLLGGVSESLAGRVGLVDLAGFSLREAGANEWSSLWVRGGFPRSYLASSARASTIWRDNFVRTFLERDIPQLGINISSESLRRFWTMVAHFHGHTWNAAEFARSLGASQGTARHYLDILAGAFMVRVLPPWLENLKKRQVKAPKVYVRDSGILHNLLGITSEQGLSDHPKVGASFEGFAIEQIITEFEGRDFYFWGTHAGAELDLLVIRDGKRYGFECKLADAPSTSRSMRVAIESLKLNHLWILYPGEQSYALGERISVRSVGHLSGVLESIGGPTGPANSS